MQNDFLSGSDSKNALGIFCRAPRLGEVKTRLAATRGDEFALGLYRAMLRDTFDLARKLAPDVVTVAVYTPLDAFVDESVAKAFVDEGVHVDKSGFVDEAIHAQNAFVDETATKTFVDETVLNAFWNGPRLAQCDGDLGARMLDAFSQLRTRGFERIALIGSDSPDLPVTRLKRAFETLEFSSMLVFGPARDGGFYLIGASLEVPDWLFEGVKWSQPNTLRRIRTNNARRVDEHLEWAQLPYWQDVDDENDLQELQRRLRDLNTRAPHTKAWLEQNP